MELRDKITNIIIDGYKELWPSEEVADAILAIPELRAALNSAPKPRGYGKCDDTLLGHTIVKGACVMCGQELIEHPGPVVITGCHVVGKPSPSA